MEDARNNILVIDDEAMIARLFRFSLKDLDCHVITAGTGEEGIERFKADRPRMVFVDIRLQAMNGIETLQAIRQMDPKVPVYIISGFVERYFDQLKELRTHDIHFEILKKPIDPQVIRTIVADHLNRLTT